MCRELFWLFVGSSQRQYGEDDGSAGVPVVAFYPSFGLKYAGRDAKKGEGPPERNGGGGGLNVED